MSKRPLRILSVADVHPDPNSGAAGTVYHTNAALRELGNHVDELWSDDLGPRRIRHGNLHSLLEQPLAYRRRIIRAVAAKDYDAILSQQPQSYLAARHLQKQHFAGAFITVSQGVENRLTPILLDWHRRLSVPRNRFPNSLFAPILQTLLARQWPLAAAYSDGAMTKAPLGGEKDGPQSHRSREIRGQTLDSDRRVRHPLGRGRRGGQRQRSQVAR
jgi:hypothetical protein